MTPQAVIKKLNQEVETLKNDVKQVKKVLYSALYDTEGEYKETFVKKILSRSKKPAPYRFSSKDSFLKHARSAK